VRPLLRDSSIAAIPDTNGSCVGVEVKQHLLTVTHYTGNYSKRWVEKREVAAREPLIRSGNSASPTGLFLAVTSLCTEQSCRAAELHEHWDSETI
ncbi:hypothetical protein AALO_G00137550, partial [Alosa alosa]